jgi:hypothetical protein
VLTSNLLVLVVAILDTGGVDDGLVGEDETVLDQVAVTGVQDGVEHGLVEKEVAHPLGDDDVDLGEGELDLLHLALDQGDLVGHAVRLDDLTGLEDDGRHVDTNDVLGAGLDGEPGERGCWHKVTSAEWVGGIYMERMAVPQPTSRTTLSLKMCLF